MFPCCGTMRSAARSSWPQTTRFQQVWAEALYNIYSPLENSADSQEGCITGHTPWLVQLPCTIIAADDNARPQPPPTPPQSPLPPSFSLIHQYSLSVQEAIPQLRLKRCHTVLQLECLGDRCHIVAGILSILQLCSCWGTHCVTLRTRHLR